MSPRRQKIGAARSPRASTPPATILASLERASSSWPRAARSCAWLYRATVSSGPLAQGHPVTILGLRFQPVELADVPPGQEVQDVVWIQRAGPPVAEQGLCQSPLSPAPLPSGSAGQQARGQRNAPVQPGLPWAITAVLFHVWRCKADCRSPCRALPRFECTLPWAGRAQRARVTSRGCMGSTP